MYTILWNKQIIGGIIIQPKVDKEYYLEKIWLIKEYQGKGIGKKALQFMENKHSDATAW